MKSVNTSGYQEIFEEFGQIGSLLDLFVTMASIHGDTEESEIVTGFKKI